MILICITEKKIAADLMCEQMCLFLSIKCDREKHLTNCTQHRSMSAHRAEQQPIFFSSALLLPLLSMMANSNREVTGLKTKPHAQDPNLRSFRSLSRRARCTLPQQENAPGRPWLKATQKGEGRLYGGLLVPRSRRRGNPEGQSQTQWHCLYLYL